MPPAPSSHTLSCSPPPCPAPSPGLPTDVKETFRRIWFGFASVGLLFVCFSEGHIGLERKVTKLEAMVKMLQDDLKKVGGHTQSVRREAVQTNPECPSVSVSV